MKDRDKAVFFWMLFVVPVAGFAAEMTRVLDGSLRFWWAFAAVQLLAILGWGASSLKAVAGWKDGVFAQQLEIIQGVLVSVLAGNIAYYGGFYGLFA